MKKIASILLSMAVVLSLSACGERKGEEQKEFSENAVLDGKCTDGQNLIVYISRVGNTEYSEGIDASASASIMIDKNTYGTTEYVARMCWRRCPAYPDSGALYSRF